jgi:hypothetical protein
MKEYENKMMDLAKKQGEAEHDKLKYSLIRKANDTVIQSIYDSHMSKAQTLSGDQLLEMENDIKANGMKLQELHYQRTKKDLLAKGQKTSMELSSVVAANSSLKLDVTNRNNTLVNFINMLTEQIYNLQQRINQQSNESDHMKIAQIQQLGELQVQIAKLELEKQNMEMYINQIRSNQYFLSSLFLFLIYYLQYIK